MAKKSKYQVVGIKPPGKINVMLDGKFKDIELHSATDDVLEKLYNQNIPYVELTPDEYTKQNKVSKPIAVTKVGSTAKSVVKNKIKKS